MNKDISSTPIHLPKVRQGENSSIRNHMPSVMGLPCGSADKEFACNARDLGLILGLGRSLGGGHGNPLQCSRLENPMDGGAWQATVYGVARVGCN